MKDWATMFIILMITIVTIPMAFGFVFAKALGLSDRQAWLGSAAAGTLAIFTLRYNGAAGDAVLNGSADVTDKSIPSL